MGPVMKEEIMFWRMSCNYGLENIRAQKGKNERRSRQMQFDGSEKL